MCKYPTLEQNIKQELCKEVIRDYRCIKCSIRSTLAKVLVMKNRASEELSWTQELCLTEEELLLSDYLNREVIDDEQFERDFKNLVQKKHRHYYVELVSPKSTITREHHLVKAPRIL